MAKKQDLGARYDDNKKTSFKQDAIVHMWIHKHRIHIHFHVDMHQWARGHVSTCSCIQMRVALDTRAAFGLYPMVHSAEYGYAVRAYTNLIVHHGLVVQNCHRAVPQDIHLKTCRIL